MLHGSGGVLDRSALGGPAARPRQEFDQGWCVEIEHLSARELSIVDRVEAEDGAIEALAARTEAALAPKNDDLVAIRCDDARLHVALRLGRLQRRPRMDPARALGPDAAGRAPI